MANINKSLYTKEQWRAIKAQRNHDKAVHRAKKSGQAMPILEVQTVPVVVKPKKIKNPSPVVETVNEPVTYTPQPSALIDANTAFVLGNGTSRKPIALNHLREWGKIYGCNGLYREFEPDFLIAVDAKMVLEICESNWQQHHQVWTNPNKNMEKFKKLNFFKPSQGWSSGPTALWMATEHQHTTIYLLGFDFVGTAEGKLNNLYGSTRNYRRLTDPATYHGNWQRQTGTVIQKNPKKQYIRVVPDQGQGFESEDFKKYHNYSEMIVSDFRNAFCRPRPVQN